MGFSVRTKDATNGGGTEGAKAVIDEIGFVEGFTYGGRQKDNPQAALRVVFNIDGFDKPWEQHYSVGPDAKYEVVGDGDGIRSVGKATGLNKKCAAFTFFEALEEAAAEADIDLDDLLPEIDGEDTSSVANLAGKTVILTNKKFQTVAGDEKELIVIAGFDTDVSEPKGKGGKPATGKASSSDAIEAKTVEAIEALIEEHTSVKKGDIANLIFQSYKKDKDVKAMMNLAFKEAFLADDERPWSYDKKKGVLKTA